MSLIHDESFIKNHQIATYDRRDSIIILGGGGKFFTQDTNV